MSKIKFTKRRKTHSYTQINNSVAENPFLSWKAKGILLYMMGRPDGWEMNKTDLINRAIDKEVSVDNGLKELKQNKYLYIRKFRNEKGHFEGWEWIYDDEPFDLETPEPAPAKDLDRNPQNIVFGEKSNSPKPIKHRNRENTEIGKKGVYNKKDSLNKKDLITKRIDDDDKAKQILPINLSIVEIEAINEKVKNEYEHMHGNAFNSVLKKVKRKLDNGEIKKNYEEYLRSALDKRIEDIAWDKRIKEIVEEVNTPKLAAANKTMENYFKRQGRTEPLPEWLQKDKQKQAEAEARIKAKEKAQQQHDLEAERARLEEELKQFKR